MNTLRISFLIGCLLLISAIGVHAQEHPAPPRATAQHSAMNDPAEPPHPLPKAKTIPRPIGAIARSSVDEKSMRALIDSMVACGTRISIGNWDDPKRGPGCGRDKIVERLNEINKANGGKLQIVVDKFDATGERTLGKPAPMQNVYAILPGTDEKLAKTVFIVSGHFDSIPSVSSITDQSLDAPGADDDASGVSVSVESARLLSKIAASGKGFRATLIFATVSGEEQGLFGSTHMEEWVKQQGYTVGGMLDDDIVGDDLQPGAPHRVRLFSGNGEIDDCDGPSRELARAVEEIDGRSAIRMIFRVDRYGRGGDHYPFYKAGLPAVRFTEPWEDYNHEHQTPRTENGVEYGDYAKFLNAAFLGNVARDNAEALRQLALAPHPPTDVHLAGGVTQDAKLSWAAEEDEARAGFEILWRETTEARWSVLTFTENAGETVLKDVSTDNHFFAVRAVGKNGARSIAVPSVPAPRRTTPAAEKK
ncbi:MAG TPA: M28 family metallopeptidase [Candidatus Eremiobacteraceae bacterium]|nr:M28 family metallopeptidase [Candidatus Eremiobacteraceae bacterium]